MDPRVLGILVLIVQAIYNQQPVPPAGGAGLVRVGLAGLIGAGLSRPINLIIGPFRVVGRGLGWLFGWGNNVNANAPQNPAFAIFEYAVREERRAVYAILRQQNPNDSGLVMCFMSKTFYNGLSICVKIIVTAAGIYIVYIIGKFALVRLYRSFSSVPRQAELEEQQEIEKKLKKLESEQLHLKSRSK